MNFQWIDCHFFLKKSQGKSEVTLNLTPFYKLQHLDHLNQVRDINFDLNITFQKPLMFDPNIGWNWHKSWNIPDITLQLMTDIEEGLQVSRVLKRLKAEIYIVKPVFSKEYSMYVEDLQLDGNTCYGLKNNRARFESLRFSSTSYSTEGSKFHFLIVVYQQTEDEQRVLISKISTPIFVDSRKSARQVEIIKLKKMSSFIEPFNIQCLQKHYIKKDCKKQKDIINEEIGNNIEGLLSYLGAANIRNKIKHPLFFAMKFSSCFQIYLNTRMYEREGKCSKIEWVQMCLEECYQKIQAPEMMGKEGESKVIILIRGKYCKAKNSVVKKIIEFLDVIETPGIHILSQSNPIPAHFQKLVSDEHLLEQYSQIKNQLTLSHHQLYKIQENSLKKDYMEAQNHEEITSGEGGKDNGEGNQNNNSESKSYQLEQSESEVSELSWNDHGNQFLNIPLKCQISIDPIKKKPLPIDQIIKLHHRQKYLHNWVKCEESNAINSRQLQVLNQLMREEITQARQKYYAQCRALNSQTCPQEIVQPISYTHQF